MERRLGRAATGDLDSQRAAEGKAALRQYVVKGDALAHFLVVADPDFGILRRRERAQVTDHAGHRDREINRVGALDGDEVGEVPGIFEVDERRRHVRPEPGSG